MQLSLSALSTIPAETWQMAALWSVKIYAGSIVLRFVMFSLMRKLGLYSPSVYRYWPRLPWRFFYRQLKRFIDWRERTFLIGKRGNTGGFASALETYAELFSSSQVLLGRAYAFGLKGLQPIGMNILRHGYCFAMTGIGKTTMLMSVISLWRGSAFVIDPKGQITKALAGIDKRNLHPIDPLHMTGLKSACFNPFDIIKWAMVRFGEEDAVRWASRIAETLIVTPPDSKSPFFTDTYRPFFVGLILHVLTAHPEEHHNLPFVRDLSKMGYQRLNAQDDTEVSSEEAQSRLLAAMRNNPSFDGIISGSVAALESAGAETAGNVRATGLEQTAWLDIPQLRNIMRTSTFDVWKLKTDNKDIMTLVAPVTSIRGEFSKFFQLITSLTTFVFEAEPKKKGQCVFVVDEHPSLNYIPMFETTIAVMRSFGISFVGIAQDIEQLKKVYPKSWEGFIGNADFVWWMATNHDANTQYLSKTLGKRSIVTTDRDTGRKSYRDVDVMTSEQLRRVLAPGSDRIIVTRAGKRARMLVNEPYFKALAVWRYNPDPDHLEPLLRRLTRYLLTRKHAQSKTKE
jgi:type IV secretory pathway TraG/TraD family ATPase VirD4